jgi:hypothetical protein
MPSQSVIEGDREPVQSTGYGSKNGEDVNAPEHSSTDPLVQSTDRPSRSRSRSRDPQTRGSPDQATQGNNSQLQANPPTFLEVLSRTLNDDEMTSRACRLMATAAASFGIAMLPVAAVAFIVMVKAPIDWKYAVSGGSTVFISVGSWLLGRRRAAKKSRRSMVTGSAEESAQDN